MYKGSFYWFVWRSNKFSKGLFSDFFFFFLPSIIVCTGSYICIKINPYMHFFGTEASLQDSLFGY